MFKAKKLYYKKPLRPIITQTYMTTNLILK